MSKKVSTKFRATMKQTVLVDVPLKAQTMEDAVTEAKNLKDSELYTTLHSVIDFEDLSIEGIWRE